MCIYRIIAYILLQTLILVVSINAHSQELRKDTVHIKFGEIIVLKDSIINPSSDTIILLPIDEKYKIKADPHFKSQIFYDSLKIKSDEKKWKSELFRLMILKIPDKAIDTTINVNANDKFLTYEGLIINRIYIAQVDIMSGNLYDTSIHATKNFPKLLNSLHISTNEKAIRKNLIFQSGDIIKANQMSDNERMLRSLNHIEDARIVIIPRDEDNADIIVITKDLFPIGLAFSIQSTDNFSINLNHTNLLGSGQDVNYRALYNTDYNTSLGNQFTYGLNNIANSFVNVKLEYQSTPINNLYFAGFNKQFLTNETKYAGGLEYKKIKDSYQLSYLDTAVVYNYSKDSEKLWIGRSFMLSKEKRINLITSGEFLRNYYNERPVVNRDTNQFFQNHSAFLGNLTYLKYKNVTTKYLKAFGATEDVRVGYLFSLTTGYLWSDIQDMYYIGLRIGLGHSFKRGGYLGLKTEYGSLLKNGNALQGVFYWRTLYYTPLIKIKHSHMRLILNFSYKEGINRYKYNWINLKEELPGLSAHDTRGTSKTTFSIEAIYFSNTYLYGFNFAPYIFGATGLIRDNNALIYDGKFHSGIGIGVRIRNESFVLKTLDFSFVYYPNNPTGSSQYRFIERTSNPEIFDDLEIGEPYIVPF